MMPISRKYLTSLLSHRLKRNNLQLLLKKPLHIFSKTLFYINSEAYIGPLSNISDKAFCGNSLCLDAVNYLRKKTSSYIFDKGLDTSWLRNRCSRFLQNSQESTRCRILFFRKLAGMLLTLLRMILLLFFFCEFGESIQDSSFVVHFRMTASENHKSVHVNNVPIDKVEDF